MTEITHSHDFSLDDLLPEVPKLDSLEMRRLDSMQTAEAIGFTSLHNADTSALEKAAFIQPLLQPWKMIEYGLAAPTRKTRQGFLDIAEERFDMLLEDETITRDIRLRAILARVAIPSFRERAEHRPMTEELQAETYDNLAQYISKEMWDEYYDGVSDKTDAGIERRQVLGFACEGITYGMLLKSGDPALFPFPAAPREDVGTARRKNHDLYIPYYNKKIPIQVKRTVNSSPSRATINVNLIPHIQPHIHAAAAESWEQTVHSSDLDTLVGRHMDSANSHIATEHRRYGKNLIANVSRSVSTKVRRDMAQMIRNKHHSLSQKHAEN